MILQLDFFHQLLYYKKTNKEKKLNMKELRHKLKAHKRKFTVEREAMLRIIKAMKGTYSLSDFYRKARKKDAFHSQTMIFRNIRFFVEAGYINEIRRPNKHTRYETVKG